MRSALRREHRAPRIVEITDGVNNFGSKTGVEFRFECGGIHPVLVQLDRNETSLRRSKNLQRTGICRLLHDHDVTGVEEDLREQAQTLLRTVGDHNFGHVECPPDLRGFALGDHLTEAPQAGRLAVLNGRRVTECVVGCLRDSFPRNEIGVGQSAGQADDVGPGSQSEQIANCRTTESVHTSGQRGVCHVNLPGTQNEGSEEKHPEPSWVNGAESAEIPTLDSVGISTISPVLQYVKQRSHIVRRLWSVLSPGRRAA
ncbi:hypothetical protein GCM10020255_068460 [Rhodococcus baikonurensis]